MPAIVCIVGGPKVGKTTLIAGLIPELKKRGYRVATIKHTTHHFEMDTEGKDSWKHAQAGSECAVLSSKGRVAMVREVEGDPGPSELSRLITDDFDIVLAEGFKRSDELKIEVHRREVGEMVCSPEDLLAVVSDDEVGVSAPRFPFGDTAALADLIEEKLLRHRKAQEVSIFADGKPVPLLPFLKHLYASLVTDLVAPLKGIKDPKRISVSIRRR